MDTTTGGTDGYEPSPAVKAHLDELDRPGLRELVLTLAGRSETARQALETAAGLAEGRRDPAENDLVRRATPCCPRPMATRATTPMTTTSTVITTTAMPQTSAPSWTSWKP